MTLADSVGAACAFLNLPSGAGTSTIESKTNFFRGVTDGHVDAVARPLHVGRRTIVVQPDCSTRRQTGRAVTQTQACSRRDVGTEGGPTLDRVTTRRTRNSSSTRGIGAVCAPRLLRAAAHDRSTPTGRRAAPRAPAPPSAADVPLDGCAVASASDAAERSTPAPPSWPAATPRATARRRRRTRGSARPANPARPSADARGSTCPTPPSTARMAPVGRRTVLTPLDGLDDPRREHHAVEQRVRRQPVGAVHAVAGRLARGPEARQRRWHRRGRRRRHRRSSARPGRSAASRGPGRARPSRRAAAMVGNRSSKRSSPVASSHRWSTPCSSMRAVIARLTPSRGQQLVDEALALGVAQQRAVARGAPRTAAAGAWPGGAAPSGGTGRTRRRPRPRRPAAPWPRRRPWPRPGWW